MMKRRRTRNRELLTPEDVMTLPTKVGSFSGHARRNRPHGEARALVRREWKK